MTIGRVRRVMKGVKTEKNNHITEKKILFSFTLNEENSVTEYPILSIIRHSRNFYL